MVDHNLLFDEVLRRLHDAEENLRDSQKELAAVLKRVAALEAKAGMARSSRTKVSA